jgi:hypothetical protein
MRDFCRRGCSSGVSATFAFALKVAHRPVLGHTRPVGARENEAKGLVSVKARWQSEPLSFAAVNAATNLRPRTYTMLFLPSQMRAALMALVGAISSAALCACVGKVGDAAANTSVIGVAPNEQGGTSNPHVTGSGGEASDVAGGDSDDAGAGGGDGDGAGKVGTYTGPVSDAACPGLPAAGTWKNISPPGSDYTTTYTGMNAIAVRPDNNAIVYAAADMHGIYKSTNCGATWAVVNTGTNGTALNTGRAWSLVIDSVTPDVMYAAEGYGTSGLWKSTNAGVDWNQVLTSNITSAFYSGGQITGISLDPGDHTHIVVESHGDCAAGKLCAAESTNSGSTWKLINMTSVGDWAENSAVVIVNRTTWLYCGLFAGLFRSADEGATWQSVSVGGALPSCNYYEPYIWQASDGRYYLPGITYGGPGLIVSAPNDTSTWTVVPNSPQASVLVPTSTGLVMARSSQSGPPPSPGYATATQADPSTWKTLTGPNAGSPSGTSIGGGAEFMAYDRAHQALYVSTFSTGLWQTTLP